MLGGHVADKVGLLGCAELAGETGQQRLVVKVLLEVEAQAGLGLEHLLALGTGLAPLLLGFVLTGKLCSVSGEKKNNVFTCFIMHDKIL